MFLDTYTHHGLIDHSEKDTDQREGNPDPDAVRWNAMELWSTCAQRPGFSGLDNAGKTTILKRFNGEPIDTISPTLGFNIKTLEHNG